MTTVLSGQALPKKHPLTPLAPFIVNSENLHVGGWLENATLPSEQRHPPFISRSCKLAQLIISFAHVQALHGGNCVTNAYVVPRAWIVGGPRKVKNYLRRCVTCARLPDQPSSQLMANLPATRLTLSRPFARTGYASPFSLLSSKGRGIRTTKGYIAVLVCLTTKALHLQSVGNLSMVSFLGALSRFIGRRGCPSEMWSDNATCFRGSDVELQAALREAELKRDVIAGTLAEQGIPWHFIPHGAPHIGGLWEAAVKSIKGHLQRLISFPNL
ncbi:uncharacterized protein LOC106644260 [Copidosoma floridanum]|uniref:uncharacterized protein LOC106644260 n=1 Tax=Copidosoma floridanum TaxID=29053 RepID=UPI0006C96127|nr:uncharacterized protein LOC106644260 [Copidosoma floridanum]